MSETASHPRPSPRARRPIAAPHRWLTAMEVRALGERLTMRAVMPMLEQLPGGDGHTVLVLPGFTADDRSTRMLRDLLRRLGYHTHGWRLGPNFGPTPKVVEGLVERIHRLNDRDGAVSIVGWSLGGVYAREMARQFPDQVRQVVTLGSPIEMTVGDRSAASRLYEALRATHDPAVQRNERESDRPPLPVPATSIYTRTDGVVHWRSCLTRTGPVHETVEVYGSHCGLGTNASVAVVVADRLAQTEGDWKAFRAPLPLRALYPRPASL